MLLRFSVAGRLQSAAFRSSFRRACAVLSLIVIAGFVPQLNGQEAVVKPDRPGVLDGGINSPSPAPVKGRAHPIQVLEGNGLVTLRGNTRPEALNPANDRGRVSDDFNFPHLMLQLRRAPEQESELEQFINDLHDPASPLFHHWISAAEFGQRFGVAPSEIARVTDWLESEGFQVNRVYPSQMVIDLTATAGQIRHALHTEIHSLQVKGQAHIANMSDPQIPADLASTVAGFYSLNDFRPRPENHPRLEFTEVGGAYGVVPADLWTIYNFSAAFAAGHSGQGQTIVVVEDTDLFSTADWTTFRSTLGLSTLYPSGTLTTTHPGGCTDPGVNGDDGEAAIDVEWATAAAPNAAIINASCSDADNGPLGAVQNLVNGSSPPAIISVSYGYSESLLGSGGNAYINSMFQQAVTEGVSLFVSSGDQGPVNSDNGNAYALDGITVSGYTTTPYNVSVGGTDFADSYQLIFNDSTYWNSTNAANFGSAKSYIPEIPWNDSCAGVLTNDYHSHLSTFGTSSLCSTGQFLNTVAGSGGPSSCALGSPDSAGLVGGTCAGYSKPSWQAGFLGNPSDGVRDIPDVSLFASNGFWGHYYVTCYSDTNFGGTSCGADPSKWSGFGGTSVSAPIMAGVQALINQATGTSWGNPDYAYYAIAASEYGASGNSACNSAATGGPATTCIFYDLNQIPLKYTGTGTGGDNNVPCFGVNCYLPSGSFGVLSTAPQTLTSVLMSSAGSGYSSNPACTLTGGGGSGATCSSSRTGIVISAALTNTGSGYTSMPTCTISGGGGTGAACAVSLSQGQTVDGVVLLNNGTGYTSNPTCAITGGSGSGAICNATQASGVAVSLTAAGTGYTTLPACSLSGGGGSGAACFALAFNTSNAYQPAFELGTGWDFPSGIGSVNVSNLVSAFSLGIPSFSSSSLSFSAQNLNTTSSAQSVTVKNIGTGNLIISTAALGGTDPGEFNRTADTCTGATVTPNNTCIVSVTFTPTASGTQTATLRFADNAAITSQTVTLSGTGAGAPEASTSGDLSFGGQFLRTPSISQTETLTNIGTANLIVSTANLGGTNPGDFSKSTDNCTGATLPQSGTCTVKIIFTPQGAGTRNATLSFNDNGQGPAGSLQSVNLSGTGTEPVAGASPASLPSFNNQFFGTTSAAQPVTLSNTGTATLTVSNIATSANFGQTNNCNSTVAAGSFCTINVTFTPTSTGPLTGTLTITDNSNAVAGSMQTVGLSGTGTAPVASPSPSGLSFNNQNLGITSATMPVTLNNTGTDTLTISNISISGNFGQTNNCNGSVAAGSFCTINVTFTPLAVGSLSGTLTITDNSNAVPGSTQMVGLGGTGVGPLVNLSASSLTFQPQPLGVAGTQTITLSNPGNATLSISGIRISGYYSQSNTCGAALASGANCKFTVTFTPRALGANTGTLTILDNAGGSPHTVALSGTGVVFTTGPNPPVVQPPPANPQPGH